MKPKFIEPQVNTVGLIGHWKLYEGTVFDYSLNGRAGTLTGTSPTYQYPGVDLPGADEHITIDDDIAFSPILSPLTVSAWVNMDDATDFVIASKYVTGDTTREWVLQTQNADLLLFLVYDETNDKSVARYYNSALTNFQGTWIHVVGTYSGGTTDASVKVYFNGTQIDDTDLGAAVFVSCRNTAAIVDIGNLDGNYANGKIDDVMIFNVEKSAAEIKSIYEVTRGRYGA